MVFSLRRILCPLNSSFCFWNLINLWNGKLFHKKLQVEKNTFLFKNIDILSIFVNIMTADFLEGFFHLKWGKGRTHSWRITSSSCSIYLATTYLNIQFPWWWSPPPLPINFPMDLTMPKSIELRNAQTQSYDQEISNKQIVGSHSNLEQLS